MENRMSGKSINIQSLKSVMYFIKTTHSKSSTKFPSTPLTGVHWTKFMGPYFI